MTQKQFERLHEQFALYANKETVYLSTAFSPDHKKKVEHKACLMGVGVGVNEGMVILAAMGMRYAIPFTDVKLPKLAWE